jgi:hypothetical protein
MFLLTAYTFVAAFALAKPIEIVNNALGDKPPKNLHPLVDMDYGVTSYDFSGTTCSGPTKMAMLYYPEVAQNHHEGDSFCEAENKISRYDDQKLRGANATIDFLKTRFDGQPFVTVQGFNDHKCKQGLGFLYGVAGASAVLDGTCLLISEGEMATVIYYVIL